jgi:hypothetical protein
MRFKRGAASLVSTGVVVAILCLAAAAANAGEFQVSPRDFRFTWRALSFRGVIREGEEGEEREIVLIETTCSITLIGAFGSDPFAKSRGTLVADLFPLTLGYSCSSPFQIFLSTLNWNLNYASFTGTLPDVTRLSLSVTRFGGEFDLLIMDCYYAYTDESPGLLHLGVSEGAVTEASFDESMPMPFGGGGFACPTEVSVSGTASVVGEREGGTARLTLI